MRSPTCRARSRPPRPRRCPRSATAPSSSSRTSSAAGTSRCRSSATVTAGCSCSASATARSSAGTRRWSRRRPPRALRRGPGRAARGRPQRGGGGRLPRRRHRRVPLRPGDRAVLLPGDEHPPPGRAPGHRGGPRRRPGRAPARRWPRTRRRSPGTTRTTARGHAIEVRLYAEDPAADYQPQSGRLTTFEIPLEDGHPGRRRLRVRQRGLDALRRDARQGRSRTRRPGRRRRGSWPACCPGPGSTGSSPTATCSSRSCATRSSCPVT